MSLPSSAGVTGTHQHTCFFPWVLESWTQVPVFVQPALCPPSCLPSPPSCLPSPSNFISRGPRAQKAQSILSRHDTLPGHLDTEASQTQTFLSSEVKTYYFSNELQRWVWLQPRDWALFFLSLVLLHPRINVLFPGGEGDFFFLTSIYRSLDFNK